MGLYQAEGYGVPQFHGKVCASVCVQVFVPELEANLNGDFSVVRG